MHANSVRYVSQVLNNEPAPIDNIALLAKNGNPLHVQKTAIQDQTAYADHVTIGNKPVITALQVPNQEITPGTNMQNATKHIFEEYNAKGKLLLTFVDNKNNVIYQIPSEIAEKLSAIKKYS